MAFIDKNVVDLLERYCGGDEKTKESIEFCFPELGLKRLDQIVLIRVLEAANKKPITYNFGGYDYRVTVDRS